MENMNEKKINFALVQRQVDSMISGYEILNTLNEKTENGLFSSSLSSYADDTEPLQSEAQDSKQSVLGEDKQNEQRESSQTIDSISEIQTQELAQTPNIILSEMGFDLSTQLIIAINQKYQLLLGQLEQIYKAAELQNEIASIKESVLQIMAGTNKSDIELQQVNKILTGLLNRVLELVRQGEIYRQRDELKNEDELTQRQYFVNWQALLERKYGTDWACHMTEEEQEQYIELYAMINHLSEDEVKANIERLKQQQRQDLEADLHYYQVLIKECFEEGLTMLRELKEYLGDDEKKIADFKRLYNKLIEVNKIIPKTVQELERKYEIIEEIKDEIEELKVSVKFSK